jgi:hypothetical protein
VKRSVAYLIAALLGLSAILLGLLVPGGPIETRTFSHISPVILALFNTFLTALGIASLVLIYFIVAGRRWAYLGAAFCGFCYFLVYALDLGGVFPVSPDEMPQALLVIEVAGIAISLPLSFLSLISTFRRSSAAGSHATHGHSKKAIAALLALIIAVGIAIIVFATRSAMGG